MVKGQSSFLLVLSGEVLLIVVQQLTMQEIS